ncbi:amino acid adenylation domain-containing protein [Streptomyces sp. NPDC001941]|uniref:amino acid adenylation domain-containing protein n=1 Tax=Streptomyces sp. NPDC001941 TaxID=3154659 RepID=UPI0033176C68
MSAPAIDAILPLTPLQEGILFHSLAEGGARGVYVAQYTVPLEGPLDEARLRAAARQTLVRHPHLRARIHHRANGQPVQVVPHEVEPCWAVAGPGGGDAALRAARTDGLGVEGGPLIRFDLVRDGADRHRFAVTAHHCVLDGWSASVLLREVFAGYAGRELAPAVPYRGFLGWLAGRDREGAERAWRRELADAPPTLLAPESAGAPPRWATAVEELSPRRTADLLARVRSLNVTLTTAVQGAWALVLARHSDREDVTFGAVLGGRPAELEGVHDMVGMLVNTVPVRVRTGEAATLAELLADVRARRLALHPHDHAGLGEAARAAGIASPLLDTTLAVEAAPEGPTGTQDFDGLRVGDVGVEERAHYPVTVVVTPGERLSVRLHHDASRVPGPLARALARQLTRVLDVIADAPSTRPGDVEPCDAEEAGRMLAAGRGARFPLPQQPCVHTVFSEQAARAPRATALVFDGERVSYGELDRRANQLAHHLVALGVGRGDWVGVRLERGPRLVTALLAALKSGAAYVLLDPDFPDARAAECVRATGCRTVVSDRPLPDAVAGPDGPRLVRIDDAAVLEGVPGTDPGVAVDGEDPACVLFTSGSQGKPKGVVAPHRALVGSLFGQEFARVTPSDVVLQCSPMSWDAFAFELLSALFAGATCVLQPGGAPEPEVAVRLMGEHRVTVAHFSSSLLNFLMDSHPSAFDTVRLVLTGGEAASPGHLERLLRRRPGLSLVNAYSPLECMMVTVFRRVVLDDCLDGAVPLGGPVANKHFYVLDDRLRVLPPGMVGEVYLGGVGEAHGYLGEAGMTAERFVADPYGPPGSRMYRSGDLARWRADGVVEYLGRRDDQVKLRGFRIEPSEVEAALARHPGVRGVRVLVRTEGPGDQRLVAYVVPDGDAAPGAEELRGHASAALPEHLRPVAYVTLDRFPTTPNGKLDRRALPAPVYGSAAPSAPAPDDPLRARLSVVFAEVLGLERVGVEDDFFHLGGHSILALRLLGRIKAEFGQEVRLRTLLRRPSVAALAEELAPARD